MANETRLPGDIMVYPSPAPGDITVASTVPPQSMAATASAGSTATFGMGQTQHISATSAGKADGSAVPTQGYGVTSTSSGAAAVPFWYLGTPMPLDDGVSRGRGRLKATLTVHEFPIPVYVYASRPTVWDVNLAPASGPGEEHSLVSTTVGVSTVTMGQGHLHGGRSTANGRAQVTKNYMSSPMHSEATPAGKGGARDQFGTTGRWYLGSSTHMVLTSRGRGGSSKNYLSAAIYMDAISGGRGGARDQFGTAGRWYLGSPHRVAMTSVGEANVTKNYLSTPIPFAIAFTGKSGMQAYLGTPFHVFSEAKGKATINVYMASRVYFAGTSPGRSSNYCYLGSPFRVQGTSAGRGGGIVRLGGTFLMPNMTIRGIGHWSLGPRFMWAHVMQGIGHMDDAHLAGTQHIATRSDGVGGMRENTILLRSRMEGSADGTEFDKPPFALVAFAGCLAYGEIGGNQYGRFPSAPLWVRSGRRFGVRAYLSSPVRMTARSAGRSTFTFPYEMIAISNAGCRAFRTYRADDNPRYFPTQGHSWTWGGVFAYQTGMVHMNITPDGRSHMRSYLSSRVYQQIGTMAGKATSFFRRIDEADFNGVGGMEPTLGQDPRLLSETVSNGVGGWPNNYLPDIRRLHMVTRGVADDWATQHGTVHFLPGLITSNGVGHFSIDPGLMIATSRGVGRMLPIPRPDQVGMQWGTGEWYYNWHFPLITDLLIPSGSNGMSRVEIEERSTGVIHHHMDGVSTASLWQAGIYKPMTLSTVVAGCYPWWEHPAPDYETPGRHRPNRSGIDWPWPRDDERHHPQGVEMALKEVEVVWSPAGIAKMTAHMQMAYLLVWQNGHSSGWVQRHGGWHYIGGAGAQGHMYLEGDKFFATVFRGRSGTIMSPKGIFAFHNKIVGIAAMLRWEIGGGSPPLDRYGNMLRYFFVPIPAYGQIWPRKERQHGQPV